jgi:hypothetical protein
MVIEIWSPRFPADSLSPRGSGDSCRLHFVGHLSHNGSENVPVWRSANNRILLLFFLALLCRISVGLVLRLPIES